MMGLRGDSHMGEALNHFATTVRRFLPFLYASAQASGLAFHTYFTYRNGIAHSLIPLQSSS